MIIKYNHYCLLFELRGTPWLSIISKKICLLGFKLTWEFGTLPYESWKMLMLIFTCAEEDCRRKEDCRKDVSVVHWESSLDQDYDWMTM